MIMEMQAIESWWPMQQQWMTAWAERAHVDVIMEQHLCDIQTYDEYVVCYVLWSRSRLTISPPDRPEHITQKERLDRSIDSHSAS